MALRRTLALLVAAITAPNISAVHAAPTRDDPPAVPPAISWPGLWGPDRNGIATTALPSLPARVRELWRRPVDGGYGELALHGDTGYALELNDGQDQVVALALDTGRERWRYTLGATYRGHDGSHDGPISTPSVADGQVYALSPHGRLVALRRATGAVDWQHDLVSAFGASPPSYGFATAPLIEGDLLLVQTGGEKTRGLLAFDRRDGTLRWNARHGLKGGYSSPVAGTIAGARQVVAASGDDLFAVDARDGRLLWRLDGPGHGDAVANSPVVLPGNRVLFTFWDESRLVEVARAGDTFAAKEVWRSPRLRSSYGPVVHRDGYLYGFSGPFLLCLDASSGDVRWRQRVYDGTLVRVGAHLIVLGQKSGLLRVVDAAPDAYREVLRAEILPAGVTAMTGPSYAAGRVYVRTIDEVAAFALEP